MWLIVLELFPGFSVQRAFYEFSKYGTTAFDMGTYGMRWQILSDSASGLREILIIMSVEWFIFLTVGYYADHVLASGSGSRCFFLSSQKSPFCLKKTHLQACKSQVLVRVDKHDVDQEVINTNLLCFLF